MNSSFSPTGYWAHYTSRWTNEQGQRESFTEALPVVAVADGRALIITEGGDVVSVTRFQQILKDDLAASVTLTVVPFPLATSPAA